MNEARSALSALGAEREGTRRGVSRKPAGLTRRDGEGEVGAAGAVQSPPHPGPLRPQGAEREVGPWQ